MNRRETRDLFTRILVGSKSFVRLLPVLPPIEWPSFSYQPVFLNKKSSTTLSQIRRTTQVMTLIVTCLGSFMMQLVTSIVTL